MSIIVPYSYGTAEFIEKKSRFTGRVWFIREEKEAKTHISEITLAEPGATHHVFAYSIKNKNIIRFSDAGEPQGTAGMPVLEVFKRGGVDNFVCVVTRYFGGILLGAGGLTRAYAKAAKLALDAAGTAELKTAYELSLKIGYSFYERIKLLAEAFDGNITETEYGEDISLKLLLISERSEGFINAVTELTAGDVTPAVYGEITVPVKKNLIEKE